MALNLIGSLRSLAITFTQNLILQTALSSDDTILLAVLGEELLTSFLSNLALLGSSSLSLSLLLCKEVLYQLLSLLLAELKLTGDGILYSLCKIINIQTLCTHRSQLATDADAQSITYFIHKIYL